MKTRLPGRRVGRGTLAGVLTGAVAIGAGQLVAGITGPSGSPVVAVGQLQIDFTPAWLKSFAIREFGGHDKGILVGGILVVLGIFAAVLGVLAMRRLAYGLVGLGVFAVVAVIAATRPTATAGTVVPTLVNALPAGKTSIAGVAWAQHKGIDAVEVRVDRGPWRPARLAAVPGIDTWRQWVREWDATPGSHLIETRATDCTGYTQTPLQAPPEPNGATGYPSVSVTVG